MCKLVILIFLLSIISFSFSATKEIGSSFEKKLNFSYSFDDNVTLTRSNQFIKPAAVDLITKLGIEFDWINKLTFRDSITALYNLETSVFQKMTDQNSYTHLIGLSATKYINSNSVFIPELNLKFYDENNPEWSYIKLSPAIKFRRLAKNGLISEYKYNYTGTYFLEDGERETYYNISSSRHELNLNFHMWHNPMFRSTIDNILSMENHEGNLSQDLSEYSDLDTGEKRNDRSFSFTFEEMILLTENVVLNTGYNYTDNWCNSDKYKYVKHQIILGIVVEPFSNHFIFIERTMSIFDFYRNQFHPDYDTTKKGRLEDLMFNYRFEISPAIQINAIYNWNKNDSNDAENYDPIKSLSYSNFRQNVLNISINILL